MEKYFEQGTLDETDVNPKHWQGNRRQQTVPGLLGFDHHAGRPLDFARSHYRICSRPGPSRRKSTAKDEKGEPAARKYSSSEAILSLRFSHDRGSVRRAHHCDEGCERQGGTDATVYNSSRGTSERLGALAPLRRANNSTRLPRPTPATFIACVKLKETQTGDTLCDKARPIIYDPVQYPEGAISFAIEPKSRQDEEKISVAIHKILEEDPALSFTRDSQTKEFLLAGFRSGARRDNRRQAEKALQR